MNNTYTVIFLRKGPATSIDLSSSRAAWLKRSKIDRLQLDSGPCLSPSVDRLAKGPFNMLRKHLVWFL